MAKIHLFPNPYAHVDHKGRLAGACPQVDGPRPQTVAYNPKHIGATLCMTEGSYINSEAEGRGPGGPRKSRADLYFKFDAIVPVELEVTPELSQFYLARKNDGSIFMCKPGVVPFEELAMARLAAEDMQGKIEDEQADLWKSQFELDPLVAKISDALKKERAQVKPPEVKNDLAEQKKQREEALSNAAKAAAAALAQVAARGTKAEPKAGGAQ